MIGRVRAHVKHATSLPRPARGLRCDQTIAATLLPLVAAAGRDSRAVPSPHRRRPTTPPSVRSSALRAGFAGHFKVGYWTPFEVTLAGGSQDVHGHVELTVLDGDAVPSRVRARRPGDSTRPPADDKTSVMLYAKVGQLTGDVTVDFRGDDGVLASRRLSTADDPRAGRHSARRTRSLIVTLRLARLPRRRSAVLRASAASKVANVDDLGAIARPTGGATKASTP